MKNAFYLIGGRPWQASAHSNSGIFMPRLSICTVMLEELAVHSQSIWQRRFQQRINDAISDLSESDISDSSQPLSSFGSPISIDTPDIMISSDISMSSDHSSTDSSDSEISITDFEVEYYQNWRHRYQELVNHISTVHVLLPAPPVPKLLSQLFLLDHWKVYCPDQFHRKLQVDTETFDSLIRLIINNPIFLITIPTALNSQFPYSSVFFSSVLVTMTMLHHPRTQHSGQGCLLVELKSVQIVLLLPCFHIMIRPFTSLRLMKKKMPRIMLENKYVQNGAKVFYWLMELNFHFSNALGCMVLTKMESTPLIVRYVAKTLMHDLLIHQIYLACCYATQSHDY